MGANQASMARRQRERARQQRRREKQAQRQQRRDDKKALIAAGRDKGPEIDWTAAVRFTPIKETTEESEESESESESAG